MTESATSTPTAALDDAQPGSAVRAEGVVPVRRWLFDEIFASGLDAYGMAIVFWILRNAQYADGQRAVWIPGQKAHRPLRRGEVVTSCPDIAAAIRCCSATVAEKLDEIVGRFTWLPTITRSRGIPGAGGGVYCYIDPETAGLTGDWGQKQVSHVSGTDKSMSGDVQIRTTSRPDTNQTSISGLQEEKKDLPLAAAVAAATSTAEARPAPRTATPQRRSESGKSTAADVSPAAGRLLETIAAGWTNPNTTALATTTGADVPAWPATSRELVQDPERVVAFALAMNHPDETIARSRDELERRIQCHDQPSPAQRALARARLDEVSAKLGVVQAGPEECERRSPVPEGAGPEHQVFDNAVAGWPSSANEAAGRAMAYAQLDLGGQELRVIGTVLDLTQSRTIGNPWAEFIARTTRGKAPTEGSIDQARERIRQCVEGPGPRAHCPVPTQLFPKIEAAS